MVRLCARVTKPCIMDLEQCKLQIPTRNFLDFVQVRVKRLHSVVVKMKKECKRTIVVYCSFRPVNRGCLHEQYSTQPWRRKDRQHISKILCGFQRSASGVGSNEFGVKCLKPCRRIPHLVLTKASYYHNQPHPTAVGGKT